MALAINGGTPVLTMPFPAYNFIGREETEAATRVLQSGNLSGFYGHYNLGFLGGPEVQALEQEWAEYFGARNAIAVNSATSGLIAAVGAARIGPGDEVIVTPLSMPATATAIVAFHGVPVFADVEPDHFCLDPASVETKITPRTKAIMVADIMGQPYDADAINEIARKYELLVIEDNAQGPGARYRDRYAGTLGDIGVFSLNYHKHIHTGEGGVVCTDDDQLALRLRMIRNHAESTVTGHLDDDPGFDLANLVGFNFRMPEIEAAIARTQLVKLKGLNERRNENANYLAAALQELPCLSVPGPRQGTTHGYYLQGLIFTSEEAGVSRDRFVQAVASELPATEMREAEGPLISGEYARPIYMLPMYQQRRALGSNGCPFDCPHYSGDVDYRPGICPTVERLWREELIVHEFMRPPVTRSDLDQVVEAFWKVWNHRSEIPG